MESESFSFLSFAVLSATGADAATVEFLYSSSPGVQVKSSKLIRARRHFHTLETVELYGPIHFAVIDLHCDTNLVVFVDCVNFVQEIIGDCVALAERCILMFGTNELIRGNVAKYSPRHLKQKSNP